MINSLLKSINESVDQTLRASMLTLGEFIEKLEALPPSKPIVFSYPIDEDGRLDYSQYNSQYSDNIHYDENHTGFGRLDSYRGYYQYLAIEPSEYIGTVEEALEKAKAAVNKTFTGYKGGDFHMDTHTLIWYAYYGNASGLKIVGVLEYDECVIVNTAFEEDEDYNYAEISAKAESKMYEDVGRKVVEAKGKIK